MEQSDKTRLKRALKREVAFEETRHDFRINNNSRVDVVTVPLYHTMRIKMKRRCAHEMVCDEIR